MLGSSRDLSLVQSQCCPRYRAPAAVSELPPAIISTDLPIDNVDGAVYNLATAMSEWDRDPGHRRVHGRDVDGAARRAGAVDPCLRTGRRGGDRGSSGDSPQRGMGRKGGLLWLN